MPSQLAPLGEEARFVCVERRFFLTQFPPSFSLTSGWKRTFFTRTDDAESMSVVELLGVCDSRRLLLLEADVDADTDAPELSASVVSLRFCEISLTFVSKAVQEDVGELRWLSVVSGGCYSRILGKCIAIQL